jgi:penicillin-binding protein 2
MSLIPPGSTFKPLTAVAGLETGVVNANYTVNDQAFFIGDDKKPIWFHSDGPNGTVNIVKAIERSSNPYFMTVGRLLKDRDGDDALAKYAWQFGLGTDPNGGNPSTGIEIPENFGQVYNSISQRNTNATQFLLNIEQYLNSGTDRIGSTKFQPIYLYDRPTDSKKVLQIKDDIKKSIKDTIKSGKKDSNKNYVSLYTPLLKELISADSNYKGNNFSDAEINSAIINVIIEEINSAIDDLGLGYNIYNASIGQGMNAFTPLQMASYISTLANGGTRYKVHLVDKITDADKNVVSQTKPEVLNKVDISPENRSLIMQGMNQVTGGGGADGTAAAALGNFNSYIPTAGKTGTAQVNTDIQAKIGRADYGWFVGYAPANDPQIAVAVVIFDGGYGSDVANVARGVYEGYFKDQLTKLNYPSFDIQTDLSKRPTDK